MVPDNFSDDFCVCISVTSFSRPTGEVYLPRGTIGLAALRRLVPNFNE
jgi:hypothetical protein